MSSNLSQSPNLENNANTNAGEPNNGSPLLDVKKGIKTSKGNPGDSNKDDKNRKSKPMTRFQCWTVSLAIIAIIVAAATGWAVYCQSQTAAFALRAVEHANRLLEAQNRPWVAFDPPPIMKGNVIEWHVKDFGTTVARRLAGRAYKLSEEQRPIWKQAEGQDEFNKGLTLNICEEPVLVSTDYSPRIVNKYQVAFPQESVPIDILLEDKTKGQKSKFIAVCIAYQGTRAAAQVTDDQIKEMKIEDWLRPKDLFHTQALYEITPNGLKLIDVDAFDHPNW